MVRKSSGAAPKPPAKTGPQVSSIIEAMEAPRGPLLAELHKLGMSLPGVAERTLYDGFCRHWTPAYYLADQQLFHVHNFRSGMRVTMFVGVRTLEPVILDSESVAHELRLEVIKTRAPRGTKQVKVPINSLEDVAAFEELVRVKWEFCRGRAR